MAAASSGGSESGAFNGGSSANGVVGTIVVDDYDYADIPVPAAFSQSTYCTNASSTGGIRLAESSSETDGLCLMLEAAKGQYMMAASIECVDHHDECTAARSELLVSAISTFDEVTATLKEQQPADRDWKNVGRTASILMKAAIFAIAF